MSASSITILGAGIAGLAAGIYAQRNGYQSRIYEMHSLPGGLCTAWKRSGYLVDGCLHWLCGSGEGMGLHSVWQELGTGELEYVNHPIYLSLELPDQVFNVYTDANEFESYLNSIAPEDEEPVHEFCQAIRDYAAFGGEFVTPEAQEFVAKWSNTRMGDLVAKMKNPKLRQAFPIAFANPMPVIFALLPLGYSHAKSAGYPMGGSLEFSRVLERLYCQMGGEIHYQARVKKILVEEDRAVGLELEDGSTVWEREGDIVSTIDVRTAFYDLLDGRYLNDGIRAWFEHIPVIGSPVMITLGVNMPIEDAPSSTNGFLYALRQPIKLYDQPVHLLNVEVLTFDPAFAPAGKSVLRVNLPGDYNYWKQLKQMPEQYEAEKLRLVTEVIHALNDRFAGLDAHIEMTDVATPVSFERYTGNWQGASQGWMPVPQAYQLMGKSVQEGNWPATRALPGLAHFYTSGQWVEPFGGVPSAALTSRGLIEMLCKRDGKVFQAK